MALFTAALAVVAASHWLFGGAKTVTDGGT
jgi:hypothetical protein